MNKKGVLEGKADLFKKKKYKIRVFDVVNIFLLTLFALLCLYPFFNQILISFATKADYYNATLLVWPEHFTLDSYKFILYQDRVGYAFLISLLVTVGGTLYNMALTVLGAYVLTKKGMPGRGIFFGFILITMFFGGGTIPLYLVIRELGIYDHIWALILPNVVSIYNIVLVRNYFYSLPESLSEAADLDGANEMQMLLHVFFPFAVPLMLPIGRITCVGRWNSWLDSLMYLSVQNDGLWMIQYTLRKILENNPADPSPASVKNAAIVIVVAPLIIASPILHRFLANGVTAGAVKG